MNKKPVQYCKPWNAGLASEAGAVAKTLGKMFDAMSHVDSYVVDGEILDDLREFHMAIRAKLEKDGWTISYVNGTLEGTNHCNVYPPGSPTGAKIRKWRKEGQK